MKKQNALIMAALCVLVGMFSTLAHAGEAKPIKLGFSPGGSNEFVFDTGVLRGKLHAGGKSTGLSSVVDVASGLPLDRGEPGPGAPAFGLFSHYRVFSANHRYGTAAWDWPSEARLQGDGSVEVHWPTAPERPFELRAVYRWAAPNILDLETRVVAKTDLARFESFLASYFAQDFTNSSVYVSRVPSGAGAKGFMPAERSAGIWQVFPRDESVIPIIRDGRWKLEPHPLDWVVMPHLEKPLGMRRSPVSGLTAVLMSPPEDCFALSTPYQEESHNSMYLSLFGRDLRAGETARACARLVIGSRLSEAEMARFYNVYR